MPKKSNNINGPAFWNIQIGWWDLYPKQESTNTFVSFFRSKMQGCPTHIVSSVWVDSAQKTTALGFVSFRSGAKQGCRTASINLINILRADFAPISFRQKITDLGVNFINFLWAAFMCIDPKSAKYTVKLSVFFCAFGIWVRKSYWPFCPPDVYWGPFRPSFVNICQR